ncbi:SLC45A1_2_4 [Lepeophtheirus salmonis]|uniref:SLC45A1_2_4 n=2 Tax=Lepeophtheirus salmonis TaxID=72036 RepID=A0A7R8D4R2_LEPSM|nr:SLC45A1_2_4 [Lepeophtheirus salmonis]CAF2974461.1 SLC45A1_2_4 [Lepeophtheirus salmonis]
MSDKSSQYESLVGKIHVYKEKAKENLTSLKEQGGVDGIISVTRENVISKLNRGGNDFEHLHRRKTRWELVRISAAIMGIEFSYAAETAFVSPTLLEIGVLHKHMTLIWCLSPLIGFFATPIMGSLSDRCYSPLGRRRPFIMVLSIGVILGLLLVPNGKLIGKQFGDVYTTSNQDYADGGETISPGGRLMDNKDILYSNTTRFNSSSVGNINEDDPLVRHYHPWGIFFTVLGTVLLDFDADSCQSPARAYLLDVTVPEDHAVGLSTFTIMAGLGGSFGYAVGAINWGWLGALFGGHVRLVFTFVLVLFIICVFFTLTSFQEIPLNVLLSTKLKMSRRGDNSSRQYDQMRSEDDKDEEWVAMKSEKFDNTTVDYGSIPTEEKKLGPGNPFASSTHGEEKEENDVTDRVNLTSGTSQSEDGKFLQVAETSFSQTSPVPVDTPEDSKAAFATLTAYLWSIIYMPNSLRILCITNLFCWMSLVCYSLYFTDFVGEAVFGGDPSAFPGSEKRQLYDDGVRFGCWGMSMYSLSCSCYSFMIEKLIKTFRAKPVYIGGQLVYSLGMVFMALSRSKWGVLIFSWSAGVMYSTLFTIPYLLVAHYHETNTYEAADMGKDKGTKAVRGIGTDVGIVSSMVFLAQFVLSFSMGYIINIWKTTTVVVVAASFLSVCGAISANFVTYLDL